MAMFLDTTYYKVPYRKIRLRTQGRIFASFQSGAPGDEANKNKKVSPSYIIVTHLFTGVIMKALKLFSLFEESLIIFLVIGCFLQAFTYFLSFSIFNNLFFVLDRCLLSKRSPFFFLFFNVFLHLEATFFSHPFLMGGVLMLWVRMFLDFGVKLPLLVASLSLLFSLYQKLRTSFVLPSVFQEHLVEEEAVRRSFFRLSGVEPFFLVRESNRLYPGYFISVSTREAISQKRGITKILSSANAQAQALMAFLGTAAGGVLVGAASYLDASNREKFKASGELIKDLKGDASKAFNDCQRQPGVDPAKMDELAAEKKAFDKACDEERCGIVSNCESGAISRNLTSEDPLNAVNRVQSKSDAFSSKASEVVRGGIKRNKRASEPLNDEVIQARVDRAVSESLKKAGIPVPPKASPSSPKAAPKGKGPGDDEGPFGGVGPFGGSGPSLPGGGSGPEHPPIPPLPSIQFSWWELFF